MKFKIILPTIFLVIILGFRQEKESIPELGIVYRLDQDSLVYVSGFRYWYFFKVYLLCEIIFSNSFTSASVGIVNGGRTSPALLPIIFAPAFIKLTA